MSIVNSFGISYPHETYVHPKFGRLPLLRISSTRNGVRSGLTTQIESLQSETVLGRIKSKDFNTEVRNDKSYRLQHLKLPSGRTINKYRKTYLSNVDYKYLLGKFGKDFSLPNLMLLKRPLGRIRDALDTWDSVLDGWFFSFPEIFLSGYLAPLKKLQNFYFRNYAYNRDFVVKGYKSFQQFIRLKSGGCDPCPSYPIQFPFGFEGLFLSTGYPVIDRIIKEGPRTKYEAERLYVLSGITRNLPLPSKSLIKDARLLHTQRICSCEDVEVDGKLLEEVSFNLGKHLINLGIEPDYSKMHLSVSNSATVVTPQSLGGKAEEIKASYDAFMSTFILEREEIVTPLGVPYSFCSCTTRKESGHICLESCPCRLDDCFIYEDKNQTWFGTSCYDSRSADILHYLAFEKCKDENLFLEGGSFISQTVVAEPGLKARIVTPGMWYVNTYLTPLAHLLTNVLSEFKPCKEGLMKGTPAFAAASDLNKFGLKTNEGVVVSDLVAATDNVRWDVAEPLLRGFCKSLQLQLGDYPQNCITLLCSSRTLLPDLKTRKGILMGEPLTKIVLTLITLLASYMSSNAYNFETSSVIKIAGDDHFKNGTKIECLKHRKILENKFHVLVDPDSHTWATKWLMFCQTGIYLEPCRRPKTKSDGPSWFMEYEDNPILEGVKLSLLSPFSKGSGFDSFRLKPLYGKARQAGCHLEWYPEKGLWDKQTLLSCFSHRFVERFYCRSVLHPAIFMPIAYGGLGLKTMPLSDVWKYLSPLHKAACWSKDYKVKALLHRISSDKYARGLEIGPEYEVFDLIMDHVPKFTKKQAQEFSGIKGVWGKTLTFLLEKHGFIPIHTAFRKYIRGRLFERSTLESDIYDDVSTHKGYHKRLVQLDKDLKALGVKPLTNEEYRELPKVELEFINVNFLYDFKTSLELRPIPLRDLAFRQVFQLNSRRNYSNYKC